VRKRKKKERKGEKKRKDEKKGKGKKSERLPRKQPKIHEAEKNKLSSRNEKIEKKR